MNPSFSSLGMRLQPPAIATLMNAALETPGVLSLAAGFTDSATLPVAEVGAAVVALAQRRGLPHHLQYGLNQGRPMLRELLAARTRQLDGGAPSQVAAEATIIGNGSQQLLYLAMQVLCDPGDIVLVERPTYFVFFEMLAGMGVRAVSLPVQADGTLDIAGIEVRLAELRASGDASRIKAVYVMSYFGNPSARSRTAGEKAALARVLAANDLLVPVLEDAAYRDLWFERPWPAPSVFAQPEWQAFPRMYLGTLTKPFATGLKTGYAHVSDASWLQRLLWLKGHHDFGSANFNQAVLETVLAGGDFDRHLGKLRVTYATKMKALSAALEEAGLRRLGWRWEEPAGGLYLWLEGPAGVDTAAGGSLWKACLAAGVLYVPGGLCLSDVPGARFARLSFGVLAPEALREAARRFAQGAAAIAPA
jgi:2-aminoadipate transaminase